MARLLLSGVHMANMPYVTGPGRSRRFGRAIRIDLIGGHPAVCSFSCAYCSSPRTLSAPAGGWPNPAVLLDQLERVLLVQRTLMNHSAVHHLVVAGNGEPTLHPAFAVIVDGIVALRDAYAPAARIVVVSNGSALGRIEVRHALARVDVRLMKLDAGDATTFRRITGAPLPLGRLLGDLRALGDVTLIARFVRNASRTVDNTSRDAIDAWLTAVAQVAPTSVQVCGQEWESRQPLDDVPRAELGEIAARVRTLGIPAVVL